MIEIRIGVYEDNERVDRYCQQVDTSVHALNLSQALALAQKLMENLAADLRNCKKVLEKEIQ